ncbi:MAG: hypothetical protein ACXW1D_00445 [Halobacteriota archaeon]
MNQIIYKNFTIEQGSEGGIEVFFISVGNEYKPYKTLNNAKGAITKHIKTQEAAHNAGMEILAQRWKEQDEQEANSKAASSDSAAYASVSIKGQQEGAQATQSRNKREGVYVGTTQGKHERLQGKREDWHVRAGISTTHKTRKQRKAAERQHKKITKNWEFWLVS